MINAGAAIQYLVSKEYGRYLCDATTILETSTRQKTSYNYSWSRCAYRAKLTLILNMKIEKSKFKFSKINLYSYWAVI